MTTPVNFGSPVPHQTRPSEAAALLVQAAALTPPTLPARLNPWEPDEVDEEEGNTHPDMVASALDTLVGFKDASIIMASNLGAVAMMTTTELRQLGVSAEGAAKLRAAFKVAVKAAHDAAMPAAVIKGPQDVYDLMRDRVALLPHEEVWALFLNAGGRVKADLLVSKSGFEAAAVDPKVIFHGALEVRCGRYILVHNHPSGTTTPSGQDRALTKKLRDQGAILEIAINDHVIIARGGFASLALEGICS